VFNANFSIIIIIVTKNVAVANRLRMSCTHDTSRASIVTQWSWNFGYRSLKVIGKSTIQ